MVDGFGKNKDGHIVYSQIDFPIGALASLDAIGLVDPKIDGSREQGFRLLKTQYWLEFVGLVDGEGPVLWGWSVGLTAAQIEEAIEADPQSVFDEANRDTNRPVFPIGMYNTDPVATNTTTLNAQMFVGEFKPRWSIREGNFLSTWAYNVDAGALTSGAELRGICKHFGVWLND